MYTTFSASFIENYENQGDGSIASYLEKKANKKLSCKKDSWLEKEAQEPSLCFFLVMNKNCFKNKTFMQMACDGVFEDSSIL